MAVIHCTLLLSAFLAASCANVQFSHDVEVSAPREAVCDEESTTLLQTVALKTDELVPHKRETEFTQTSAMCALDCENDCGPYAKFGFCYYSKVDGDSCKTVFDDPILGKNFVAVWINNDSRLCQLFITRDVKPECPPVSEFNAGAVLSYITASYYITETPVFNPSDRVFYRFQTTENIDDICTIRSSFTKWEAPTSSSAPTIPAAVTIKADPYFIMEPMAEACPAGHDPITSEEACKTAFDALTAADVLKKTDGNNGRWQGASSISWMLKGCYWDGGDMYWNTHATGQSDGWNVCKMGSSQAASASAVGDPHLVNLRGDKFDLNMEGEHLLLQIPEGSGKELEVLGFVERLPTQISGQSPCDQFLFTKFRIRGTYVDEHKGEVVINAGQNLALSAFGAAHQRHGKSTSVSYDTLLKHNTSTKAGQVHMWACKDDSSKEQRSLCKQLGTKAGAGNRQLRVFSREAAMIVMELAGAGPEPLHLAFSRFEGAAPAYLNLALHGLSRADNVGGLLGSGDHTDVSQKRSACQQTHHAKERPAALHRSQVHQEKSEIRTEVRLKNTETRKLNK